MQIYVLTLDVTTFIFYIICIVNCKMNIPIIMPCPMSQRIKKVLPISVCPFLIFYLLKRELFVFDLKVRQKAL